MYGFLDRLQLCAILHDIRSMYELLTVDENFK